jgi:AH receptor-interacting protein
LNREKPGDEDFVKLDVMKVPFYLNLAQCQLFLEDYYPAIEQTNEVLKRDPGEEMICFMQKRWFMVSLSM